MFVTKYANDKILTGEKMNYNLLATLGFVVFLALNYLLFKFRYTLISLRIISIFLLVYKICFYVYYNITTDVAWFPFEISTLSYFIIAIVLIFNLEKVYNIASFLGIITGLGYFVYYIVAGGSLAEVFTIKEIIIGILCHGFLLTAGLQLMKLYKFDRQKLYTIWIAVLGIICYALEFYDMKPVGVAFIYYVIKPTYLYLFDRMIYNVLLVALFYVVLLTAVNYLIKLFYFVNAKIHKNDAK